MKNRIIYKIITSALLVSVLLFVFCVSSSAYTYEGKNGKYYIPDKLYYEYPITEDFVFPVDNSASVKREFALSYFTANSNVSQNGFNGENMLLYNSSLIPHYNKWVSYVFGVDLNSTNPTSIYFTYIASVDANNIPELSLDLIFQEPEDFGTPNYNSDNSISLFYISDLLNSGRDFVSEFSYSDNEDFVTVVVDVDVLIDPNSSCAFFTLTDENGDSLCLAEHINLDSLIGFRASSVSEINSNWDYMGFGSDNYECGRYSGFSCYTFVPMDNSGLRHISDKSIILDGSSYEGMTPNVTNYSNGFSTDYNGYPVMENGYYKLTTNSSSSSQAQLWFPSQEYGISGFSSEKHSYGELSFDISAAVRDYVEFKFVEGIEGERWGSDWCIEESFIKIVPVDISFDTGIAVFDVLGCGGVVLTQHTVDVYNEPYANWFNVEVKITLDPIADAILLDYYIDGEYVASCSTPLTTANNSITSIYCSLRTEIPDSGILFDNFNFYYVNDDDYRKEYEKFSGEFYDKMLSNESLPFYKQYVDEKDYSDSLKNDLDLALECYERECQISEGYRLEILELEESHRLEILGLNKKLLDYKNNADVGSLFNGISESILIFIRGVSSLGYTTSGGISITIGGLLTVAVLGAFLTFILKKSLR